jgi:hypothetical protein
MYNNYLKKINIKKKIIHLMKIHKNIMKVLIIFNLFKKINKNIKNIYYNNLYKMKNEKINI